MKPQLSAQKIATLIALLALLLSGASCSKSSGPKKPDNVDYYTCTMHPSVKSQDPNGKCPICSMDLVPVMKRSGGEGKSSASPAKPEGMKDMQGMKGGGEMKGMSGMEGMPGMKGDAETKAPQTSEFVVPVERQQQIGVRWAKAERKPLRHAFAKVQRTRAHW